MELFFGEKGHWGRSGEPRGKTEYTGKAFHPFQRGVTSSGCSHRRHRVKAHCRHSPWAPLTDFTEATCLQRIATLQPGPKDGTETLFPAGPSLMGMLGTYYGSETRLHSLGWESGKSFGGQTGKTIKARREAAASACRNGQSLPKGRIPYSVMSCLTSRRDGMGSTATWRRVVPR